MIFAPFDFPYPLAVLSTLCNRTARMLFFRFLSVSINLLDNTNSQFKFVQSA